MTAFVRCNSWFVRLAFLLALGLAALTARATPNYQDWWWDASKSGMGVNIGQQGKTVAVAWYHFDSAGRSVSLSLVGELFVNDCGAGLCFPTGPQGVVQGSLMRASGSPLGPNYDPSQTRQAAVGTASLSFTSHSTAVLAYEFEGKSGTLDLSRFSFAATDVTIGRWEFVERSMVTDCTDTSRNRTNIAKGFLNLARSSGAYELALDYDNTPFACTFKFPATTKGSTTSGTGTVACSGDGTINETVEIDKMRESDSVLGFEYTIRYASGACVERGRIGAVK